MIKDYHDLKCVVSLLADAFEKFRNNGWTCYGLCPSHYLSVLALSWDAMLKVGLSPSKKHFLFASMIAFQKGWKMLFISS